MVSNSAGVGFFHAGVDSTEEHAESSMVSHKYLAMLKVDRALEMPVRLRTSMLMFDDEAAKYLTSSIRTGLAQCWSWVTLFSQRYCDAENSRNQAYIDHVRRLEQRIECKDEAMRLAVGGEFDAVGKLEYYLLRSLGLSSGHLVIDVGCGSGRLAQQLAGDTSIRYVGTDVVPRLLEAARTARRSGMIENSVWLKASGSRVRTMWPISSRSSLFSPTSPTRRVFYISGRQRAA